MGKFSVFLEGVVEKIVHRDSRAGYLYCFIHEIGCAYLVVGEHAGEGVTLAFEPVGMHEVRVEAHGDFLQHVVGIKVAEEPSELGCLHDFLHFFVVRLYLFAQGFQQFFVRVPYPAGEKAMPGLQVDVVAATLRVAPALRGNEHTEPLLVGGFVLREAYIAVYAPDTIFGLQVSDRGVVLAEATDELGGEIHEATVAGLVLRLVGIEPLAVVVHRELGKERKDRLHGKTLLRVRPGDRTSMT